MIRSIVSTPRVEPTRHGVHLPHDSIEQNSIAKRAIRGHVDGLVEDHDAAVAEHRAGLGEGLVVHRHVEAAAGGTYGAERTPDLDGPHRAAGQRAAAVVLDELAQADAERQLDDAALLDVAGELEDLGAARAAGAERGVGRPAVGRGSSGRRTA